MIDCPPNLVIHSDRLRLKQVILNLAINASKFVEEGFIRLGARVHSSTLKSSTDRTRVHVFVEDSGPGIPLQKRPNLFQRYQESLDSMSQGTGVGLFLVKKLVDCMEGEIYLDESFDSGVEGCPGSRIVVKLRMASGPESGSESWLEESASMHLSNPPDKSGASTEETKPDEPDGPGKTETITSGSMTGRSESMPSSEDTAADPVETNGGLPENLTVLFVYDDRTLRKLARRCITRLVPNWTIMEASSGEMALSMITSTEEPVSFDIIFMDQYMTTCAGQALKGTETTRQLRALGIRSPLICGLSANGDSEGPFLSCGADAFWLKPFPCRLPELRQALQNLLAMRQHSNV